MRFLGYKYIPLLLLVFLRGLSFTVYGANDNELDRLTSLLVNAEEDTMKVNILLKLSNESGWSDSKASEDYAKQALQLSQKINFEKGMAYANFRLANIFSQNEFDLAEKLVLQSLDYALKNSDSMLIADVYKVLGILKDNISQYNEALSYYNKSLDIYLNHQQDSSAAAIYNNIGILYFKMYGDSTSISYYLKAAEINKRTKNFLSLAINYQNIGYELLESGKLEEGYDYLQQSLQIADEHSFVRLLPWIYNNFSLYYFKKQNYSESIKYAEKSLAIARDESIIYVERNALSNLKDAYYKLADLEKAYFYLEQIGAITDTINKHNRLKELDLLEMRFKYEQEKKAQELENALLEASYYKKELIYVIAILGSGLIIIIFVFLYFSQRNRIRRKNLEQKTTILEKEKLSKDLEYKNKELTTNVMYLLKKNEFISTISAKLKNVNLDAGDNYKRTIERIIIELDKSISDNNWEDFEVRFQEVHVGFYNKLSKRYPALTPNELRLCAFLRLNMTSKEIADITFQSTDSLKTARYRLRKKLNLPREDNLVAFLTKL
jgi:tetratricopeptide (TPR) repeat protein/DNA-binding CsgD family transcriptional regulator